MFMVAGDKETLFFRVGISLPLKLGQQLTLPSFKLDMSTTYSMRRRQGRRSRLVCVCVVFPRLLCRESLQPTSLHEPTIVMLGAHAMLLAQCANSIISILKILWTIPLTFPL